MARRRDWEGGGDGGCIRGILTGFASTPTGQVFLGGGLGDGWRGSSVLTREEVGCGISAGGRSSAARYRVSWVGSRVGDASQCWGGYGEGIGRRGNGFRPCWRGSR